VNCEEMSKDASSFCPIYKWGQTDLDIIITVEVNEECINSHSVSAEGKVEVQGNVPKKGDFKLALDLYGEILAARTEVQLLPPEVQLLPRSLRLKIRKKLQGETWKSLQKLHIPKPAQERKDFDFFVDSDGDDDDDDDDLGSGLDQETKKQIKELREGKGMAKPKEKPRSALFGILPEPDEWDYIVFFVALFQIYMSPFTKVEESFNVQAMHDMIFERQNLDRYDHFQFPGVVPRTFIGAFINAVLAAPICLVFDSIYAPRVISLFICRAALAALSVYSLATFRFQVEKKFGKIVSACFAVICSIQFHLLFYCSRPLPNTYASIFVNFAFAFWLKEQYEVLFSILAFSAIVFRSELVVLAAPIFVSLLVLRKFSSFSAIVKVVATSVMVAILSLCLTISFDSFFWRRWLWPEGEVFYFNTILNKSSQWGVMPWHWYFSSALPRAMMGTLFLLPGGLMFTQRMRPFFFPVLAFICLYSFLPHKELRFIIYALPIFNCVCAVELGRLYINRNKECGDGKSWKDRLRSPKFFFRAAVTLVVFNVSATYGFTRVASTNYPGGDALILLHEMERHNVTAGLRPFVHIDVPAAQQGISRFLELSSPWRYSKREEEHDMDVYTHLITDKHRVDNFTAVITLYGLDVRSALMAPRRMSSMQQIKMRVFKRNDINKALVAPQERAADATAEEDSE